MLLDLLLLTLFNLFVDTLLGFEILYLVIPLFYSRNLLFDAEVEFFDLPLEIPDFALLILEFALHLHSLLSEGALVGRHGLDDVAAAVSLFLHPPILLLPVFAFGLFQAELAQHFIHLLDIFKLLTPVILRS